MVRCCIRGAASDSFNRVRQDIGPRWQLGRGGCGKYAQPPGQQTWRLRPTPSVRSRLMGLAAAASHRMQQSNQGLVLTRGRVGGGRWRSHTFERGPKRVGRLGGDVGVPCRAATIPRLLVYKRCLGALLVAVDLRAGLRNLTPGGGWTSPGGSCMDGQGRSRGEMAKDVRRPRRCAHPCRRSGGVHTRGRVLRRNPLPWDWYGQHA